ncbi:hypothetical protein SOVF_175770 [Spinacia oleracea]|nr:hypothetical protein SOVF_175770 [Spinacia oleracea]
MDNFLKSIKVIRLKTYDGRYLTAHEDQESLAIRKPGDKNGPVAENTEWKVMWLGPGKCCLKSIYGKVLTVRRGWFVVWVNQEPWPVADGAGDWYLQITNQSSSNVREFQAKLLPVKESGYSLEATDYGVFLSSTTFPYLRSAMSGWTVEVVKTHNTKQRPRQQNAGLMQVGQMVFNVADAGGGGPSGGFSQYNAGHNYNGSGTQTNGDVNVHTEIGRQGDFSVNFNNNRH